MRYPALAPSPLRRLACLLVLLLLGSTRAAAQGTASRPNIVLIMADDMGFSDLGAYGGEIRTPALDRLAEGGLRFTRFYNAARCCPTRAALLTGLYPHQAGMGGMVSAVDSEPEHGPYQGFLNDRSVTLAEVLREAGYRTYMSGKWHVGERPAHWPRRRGFDRYFGLISGASSYYELIKEQPRQRQMVLDDTPWEPPADGFYMTDAITDYAVDFVRAHDRQEDDAPFFLYVAYTAPHWPMHALPEDIARYKGRYGAGWDAVRRARYERMRAMGLIDERYTLPPRPDEVPAWEDAEDQARWERLMEVYAAMVDRMDQGIGRVMEAIRQAGEEENTLVLFLADNGGCAESVAGRGLDDPSVPIGARGSYVAYEEPWAYASNTPFRLYKQWVHEGGIATPLIAYWPAGIAQPGRITDQVGHVVDLMATGLDAAGARYPARYEGRAVTPLEGKSLLPILAGRTREGHDALFWEHVGNWAVREGPWKLVYDGRRDQHLGLFHMEDDPTETQDLSTRYPEKVDALRQRWNAWARRVGVRTGD